MAAEDTRSRILREASALFTEQGLFAFSMRKLAQRVGITATAIYRHFDSKEAVIAAVCHEGFTLFAQHLWRSLEEKEPRGRFRRMRLEYVRFAIDHAHFYRTMFMTAGLALGWEVVPEVTRERAQGTFQFLVDRVRECQEASLLRAGDTVELALQIWALGHGLSSLRLAGQLDMLDAAAFEALYVTSCEAQERGLQP
jgi:AcrR family transcriptional regulator